MIYSLFPLEGNVQQEDFGYYKQFLDYICEKLSMRVDFVDHENYAEINALNMRSPGSLAVNSAKARENVAFDGSVLSCTRFTTHPLQLRGLDIIFHLHNLENCYGLFLLVCHRTGKTGLQIRGKIFLYFGLQP